MFLGTEVSQSQDQVVWYQWETVKVPSSAKSSAKSGTSVVLVPHEGTVSQLVNDLVSILR